MKTMFPPVYHHYGFVATHTLGHIMCPKCMICQEAIVMITWWAHRFYDCIYITPILLF